MTFPGENVIPADMALLRGTLQATCRGASMLKNEER